MKNLERVVRDIRHQSYMISQKPRQEHFSRTGLRYCCEVKQNESNKTKQKVELKPLDLAILEIFTKKSYFT